MDSSGVSAGTAELSTAELPAAVDAEHLPESMPPAQDPKALSGTAHLLFFTLVQFLVYFDRSALASVLKLAKAEFALDGMTSGLLQSGFMGGFIVASPVVALITGSRSAKVMGTGLAIWAAASFVVAIAPDYSWFLAARTAAGAGEAAYCSLAPPIIEDTAPAAWRSAYLSIYFSTIFIGMALGFLAQAPCSSWFQARFLFLLEALAMLPFVWFILRHGDRFRGSRREERLSTTGLELARQAQTVDAEGSSRTSSTSSLRLNLEPLPWWRKVLEVLSSRTYCLLLFGYSTSIFSLGGFAFWLPTYLDEDLHVDEIRAGKNLCALTGLSGIVGTVAGGVVLDAMTTYEEARSGSKQDVRARASVQVAFWCACLSVPFVMIAVWAADAMWLFYAGLALGQLFVFMSTAPVNVAMMEAIPSEYRGLALGICTTTTHLLGDTISPALIGWVKDKTGSLVGGVWLLSIWPIWCVIFWGMAAYRRQ